VGTAWKNALDSMLKHVAAEGPSMKDAIEWLIQTFDRVESRKTARGYWQVLRSFGLVDTEGEQLVVTALGSEYLEDPTDARLFQIARDRIVGINEMVEWLREAPRSVDELLAPFREHLDVEWESGAQIQFRLGWLTVLGVTTGSKGRWQTV